LAWPFLAGRSAKIVRIMASQCPWYKRTSLAGDGNFPMNGQEYDIPAIMVALDNSLYGSLLS
jgi:thiamine pyrophosphate-dependent acetolactate synthase large subunit-like protein